VSRIGFVDSFRFIESPKPRPIPAVELGRDIVADLKREMQMSFKKKGKGGGR
jgi:hypothetical protein